MLAIFVDLRIAFMNLLEHRRRTLFLGTAVAMVTCLFVLLSALAAGIRHTLIDTATTLSTGHLNVGGFFKVTSGQVAPVLGDYARVSEIVKRSMPELEFLVARGRGWGKVISDRGSLQAGIGGLDIGSEQAFKQLLEVVAGDIEQLALPNTLLIFEQQAKNLGLAVGDTVTISAQTARGSANTLDCRVVAVARDLGLLSNWAVYVSNESLRNLTQLRSDASGALQIHVKPEYVDDLGPIAERLRGSLARAGYDVLEADPRSFFLKQQSLSSEEWTGQKLDVTTWQDELSFMTWTFQSLQALTFMLMIILLAIMVAGIMNTLWIAIRERTREIGTLRAIGMQQSAVARMFLFEAALLGSAGAALGIALGVLFALAINAAGLPVSAAVQVFLMRDTLHLQLETGTLALALGLITFVTSVAALYPSIAAARREPVDAMAHFG